MTSLIIYKNHLKRTTIASLILQKQSVLFEVFFKINYYFENIYYILFSTKIYNLFVNQSFSGSCSYNYDKFYDWLLFVYDDFMKLSFYLMIVNKS